MLGFVLMPFCSQVKTDCSQAKTESASLACFLVVKAYSLLTGVVKSLFRIFQVVWSGFFNKFWKTQFTKEGKIPFAYKWQVDLIMTSNPVQLSSLCKFILFFCYLKKRCCRTLYLHSMNFSQNSVLAWIIMSLLYCEYSHVLKLPVKFSQEYLIF